MDRRMAALLPMFSTMSPNVCYIVNEGCIGTNTRMRNMKNELTTNTDR
jgi:hypothetical protein